MMNKLIRNLAIALAVLLAPAVPVLADTNGQLFDPCKTNAKTAKSPICQPPTTTNPINEKIKVAAAIVAIATGLAAVIFIILGGITMITSGGNAENVANARKRIIYAVVGLVIVGLAYTIISFVTDKLIK